MRLGRGWARMPHWHGPWRTGRRRFKGDGLRPGRWEVLEVLRVLAEGDAVAGSSRAGGRGMFLGEVPLMTYAPISFAAKFALFSEQWQPKVVAEMNDYQFKVVRIEGDFVWHSHADTDETFIVLDGSLRIDFRDGAVSLKAGEMFVVPKGKEHKPFAEGEVQLLLIEPRGVANTGDGDASGRTARNDVWI
jgi:mannose-6-phosphate isomerase-like protein (cupin superfamily)